MRQCSELNRGKLEFHPEKEGALWSPVLVGVAHCFAPPASNHNGVLHREVTLRGFANGKPNKGAKHPRNREVGLFKKKKKVFEVLSE